MGIKGWSAMKGLDEYTDDELVKELQRRLTLRYIGICDYCNRPIDASKCRFPDRHKAHVHEVIVIEPHDVGPMF